MNKVFIGLGSNQGNREENIHRAIELLGNCGEVKRKSTFYYTEAEEMALGHDFEFVNAVCELHTHYTPDELMDFLLKIEKQEGRIRINNQKTSRIIDLDILLFNDSVINSIKVSVPHPKMIERLFVIEPLAELIPDFKIPGSDMTITTLKHQLLEKKKVG